MVFYHGTKPYDGHTDIRKLIKAPDDLIEQILFKPFHLIDTHHLPDETLREQHWAGVMAFVMKHIYDREILSFAQGLIDMLQTLEKKWREGATDYLVLLLNYVLNTGETKQLEVFIEMVQKGCSTPVGEKVMTIAEQLMQKGESSLLSNLLEHKFGAIPHHYRLLIKQADSKKLLNWSKKVLDAHNLNAVFEN